MSPFKIENLSKVQIGMLNEYIDLILCGYLVQHQTIQRNWWFIKLKHKANGRTLILEWKPDRFNLREKNVILKNVGLLA